jgi:hypothetical protein
VPVHVPGPSWAALFILGHAFATVRNSSIVLIEACKTLDLLKPTAYRLLFPAKLQSRVLGQQQAQYSVNSNENAASVEDGPPTAHTEGSSVEFSFYFCCTGTLYYGIQEKEK